MKPIVSPKELSQAIGVSESSIKRWVDDGLIRAEKTTGGHRRISIHEVIRFTRDTQTRIIRPELLGISEEAAVAGAVASDTDAVERLHRHLMEGDAVQARGLIMALYLMGRSVAEICDGPIRIAMGRIGAMFLHDEAGVFFEHRATEICIEALNRVRVMMDTTGSNYVAIGSAPAGDTHALPTLAAATVLESEGYHAVNLGPDTPVAAMVKAAETYRPRFVWVSLSWIDEPARSLAMILSLFERLSAIGTPLAIGGQALGALELPAGATIRLLDSMRALADYGRSFIRPSAD